MLDAVLLARASGRRNKVRNKMPISRNQRVGAGRSLRRHLDGTPDS